jgi:hypothetical protein
MVLDEGRCALVVVVERSKSICLLKFQMGNWWRGWLMQEWEKRPFGTSFLLISWFWFCGVWKNAGGATPFYSENFKASWLVNLSLETHLLGNMHTFILNYTIRLAVFELLPILIDF